MSRVIPGYFAHYGTDAGYNCYVYSRPTREDMMVVQKDGRTPERFRLSGVASFSEEDYRKYMELLSNENRGSRGHTKLGRMFVDNMEIREGNILYVEIFSRGLNFGRRIPGRISHVESLTVF